ncbi:type III secretion inner membrane ring lipoprotein SctJ [Aeromonas salmonicida]|uniref:type III secretion system inner membrane ring lipoprotein SctJ n=1 Tax=Aeromonas salmonicida TaxID=645 RepID=UPI00259F451A|nr:type III secretion inner membrane ring lipoprotein SctJ [Aeromonas salmonicida]MDM5065366.1 type III secretion inner membrane ring lipoprotein SctJ [Aeromonas salmonicida]
MRYLGAALLVLCLAGCKAELYSGLSEEEANQMLALLMLRGIDSEKQVIKPGNVTLNVDKARFADAVEILRQQGLPRQRTETIGDLFPSGQLVTSPAQEQAKINYLKEQTLEKMLRGMDGVINAQVSIAESVSHNRRETPRPSASVFIKYSPGVNMTHRETDIRRLIQKGVPNLAVENISVVLQATDYRYQRPVEPTRPDWRRRAPWLAGAGGLLLLLLTAGGIALSRRRTRSQPSA